mgnify:CR=1 FL=1
MPEKPAMAGVLCFKENSKGYDLGPTFPQNTDCASEHSYL